MPASLHRPSRLAGPHALQERWVPYAHEGSAEGSRRLDRAEAEQGNVGKGVAGLQALEALSTVLDEEQTPLPRNPGCRPEIDAAAEKMRDHDRARPGRESL